MTIDHGHMELSAMLRKAQAEIQELREVRNMLIEAAEDMSDAISLPMTDRESAAWHRLMAAIDKAEEMPAKAEGGAP